MQRLNVSLTKPVLLERPEDVLRLGEEIQEFGLVSVDTETTGLDIVRDQPLFCGLSTYRGRYALRTDPGSKLCEALAEILGRPNLIIVTHNGKYDRHMLFKRGIVLLGLLYDTMTMAMLSDTSRSSKKLKDLNISLYGADDPRALRYKDFQKTFGKVSKNHNAGDLLSAAPLDTVLQYVTCDTWSTLQNCDVLRRQLTSIINWRGENLWDLYLRYEVPFTNVLWQCEHVGSKVDSAYLTQLGEEWSTETVELEKKFAIAAGRPYNIRSKPDLRRHFMTDLSMPAVHMTDGGASGKPVESVDKTSLEYWAKQCSCETASLVLRYNELRQLLSHFVIPLLDYRDQQDRVHTTFGQGLAETGRLTSETPNLQNIPVRSKDGAKIRRAFIADEGKILVVRDCDQLEMKLAAALSGDEAMMDIIRAGKDIHSGNASVSYHLPYEDIIAAVAKKEDPNNKEPLSEYEKRCIDCRKNSKTIGFETLYGGGLARLAVLLKLPMHPKQERRESLGIARQIQEQFFAPFHRLRAFIDWTHEEVQKSRCIQTLLGRFRQLPAASPGMKGSPAWAEALRQSFNATIQGTAADVVKLIMLQMQEDPLLIELGAEQRLQVHDEVMLEVPIDTAARANERFRDIATNWNEGTGLQLGIPLTTTGKVAPNWAEAK